MIPFVSFILPAYKAKFLHDAIVSVFEQTYANFELVIVDDASPEAVEEVVDSFDDKRIRYFKNEKNLGGINLVNQWNHSITFAKGEYLVLAADDDIYEPNYLQSCIDLILKHPTVDIIRTGALQIDEDNNIIGANGILSELCSKYQFVYLWLHAVIFTCIGNYMFKTSVLKEKQFIDFPFAFGSDTASCINMADNGVLNTDKMLFKFRISSIHTSSNKGKLKEKLEANTKLFEWLRDLNYKVPSEQLDKFYYNRIQWHSLYSKCKYDYYNLVIKYLPMSKVGWIRQCKLLN